jgi:hypothetical protein
MQKRWIIPGLLAAAFAFAATGAANNGHGSPHSLKFGPYTVVTDDHGSCGQAHAWAIDTELRTYKIKRNLDGTFRLIRRDHGTFLTNAGESPGACETHGRHGSTVPVGKTGHFRGYLIGTVSGGTFNPNATCPANCGDIDVWIATFFGPNATFSCFKNSANCKFNFQYYAPRQHLKYHHWYDKGKGAGTLLHEKFRGDIAAS